MDGIRISEIIRIVEVPLPFPFGGPKKLYSDIQVQFPLCDDLDLAKKTALEIDKSKFENIANSVLDILDNSILELNDTITRESIRSTMFKLCENIQQEQEIYDYRPICDATNNTPNDIDNNKLNANLFLKPSRGAFLVGIFSSVGPA